MESKDDIISFSNSCRICLEIHNQMIPIHSLKEHNELGSLLVYFNIEVINDNRYPNRICTTCMNQLNSTLSLKQKCVASFNHLKEILKDPFNKNEDDSLYDMPIKDELSPNTFDDFENESIKSENSNNVKQECDGESMNKVKNEQSESFASELERGDNCDNLETNKKLHENVKKRKLTRKRTSLEKGTKSKERRKHFEKRIHPGEKQPIIHACTICPKTFKKKSYLKRHIFEVHENKDQKYYCQDCKTFYTLQRTLDLHRKKYHSDNPPPKVVCKECGLSVTNIHSHMKHKHSVYEFECKYCKKMFPYRSLLAIHVDNVHENREGTLKFLCTLCGKAFRTRGELTIHNKINHSDERNYQCTYCERRFKTSSSCRKHERSTHLNDRCYKCDYCPKAFTRKKTLVNHIRTHTGEKPFVCNICSRAFAQKTTLVTHTKLIHGRALK